MGRQFFSVAGPVDDGLEASDGQAVQVALPKDGVVEEAEPLLYRITGVDLTRIDGVDAYTALKVVSEIGTDMSKWSSAGHFASWLGLSPANRITGGRIVSSRTKRNAIRAAALRLAAGALHHSDSALGVFYRRKRAQLGSPKAITAAAHKLARIIYSMLRHGQNYVGQGADYYENQYRQRAFRAAQRRAAQLGYDLVPSASPNGEAAAVLSSATR